MNNWRLLLLAVVAVLQPIGSFTESNLIDGNLECCDHGPNSITQETRLYGNSRKTTPEDRRLSPQDFRKDSRSYETRYDPVRARERLTVQRTERRVSPKSTRIENRKDQERRQPSINARETRQIREDQNRKIREDISKNFLNSYERDAFDTRRIRLSRDNTRIGRDSVRTEDIRRVRNTMVHTGERTDVARDETGRDSRFETFRTGNGIQDNNRERRSLNQRVREKSDENRRTRALDMRTNGIENRRSDIRIISERVDERRQGDQNREFRVRTGNLRDSSERVISDRRLETRGTTERMDPIRMNIREYHSNERMDDYRQNRVDNKLSREQPAERRQTKLNNEQRQSVSRESRRMADVQSERILKNNNGNSRREPTRDMLRASRDSVNERRHNSALNTNRILNSVRNDEMMRDDHRKPSTLTQDRVSVRTSSEREITTQTPVRNVRDDGTARNIRVRSAENMEKRREQRHESRVIKGKQTTAHRESRENVERRSDIRRSVSPTFIEVRARSGREFRVREMRDDIQSVETHREREITTRTPVRNVRDNRITKNIRVRSAENMDERREQSYESRVTRDRQTASLRESRENFERRSDNRRSVSPAFFGERARSGRESRVREMQDDIRSVETRREREVRRATREQTVHRISRDTELRQDKQLSRTSRIANHGNSDERVSRIRENVMDERSDVRREANDENIARAILSRQAQRRFDTRSNSRNIESNSRLQRVRSDTNPDIRRETLQRDETRASNDRISMSRLSRIEGQRRESRESARDKIESRSQNRLLQWQAREVLTARSREFLQDVSMRSERSAKNREDRRTNERDVRNNESRSESRLKARESQLNRHVATERMNRIREVRIEAKLRTDTVINKELDSDTRREARETRFRSFAANFREMDPIDETYNNQNTISWQMMFYTLQGAYLCGLLIQMLTEKSNKDKQRNFTTWWSSASKDLIKVD